MSFCRQIIWLGPLLLVMACITLAFLIVLFLLNSNDVGFGSSISNDDSLSAPSTAFNFGDSEECSSSELASIWATLPQCRPRSQLLDLEINDPEIIQLVPSMLEIERCTGACQTTNDLFRACVPSQIYNKSIKVMIRTTQSAMKCAEIQVEAHKECECGCNIDTCPSSLQELDSSSCTCNCANSEAKFACFTSSSKIWDEQRCSCLCRPDTIKPCSTGFVFDAMRSCECVRDIRTRINVAEDGEGGTSTANLGILGLLIVLVVFAAICIVWLVFKLRIASKQLKSALKNAKESINDNNQGDNQVIRDDANDDRGANNEVALPLRQSLST